MNVDVSEEPITALAEYGRIPIAFEVSRVFDVTVHDGEFKLSERILKAPYIKDYDASDGDRPQQWSRRFDLSNWGLFTARLENKRVGGAAVAFNTANVTMLENRRNLAVLWDIRVFPDARGQRIGSALFRTAEAWATAKGCRELKVETQNVNVPACRFYAKQGCRLRTVHQFAYPGLPDEVQLLWYKNLSGSATNR